MSSWSALEGPFGGSGGGGEGSVLLMPGACTLPDSSSGNAPAALTRIQGTESNPKKHFMILGYDGAGSTIEYAWWAFPMPPDYSAGDQLDIAWYANTTTGNVNWNARVGAITAGDADTILEHACAAEANVTTSVDTTEANRVVKSTITLNMDGAVAGDVMFVTIYRDPNDDTCTADANLAFAIFRYTRG